MLKESTSQTVSGDILEEMKKAGVIYGHIRSRCHPQAKYFTLRTNQSEITFIDLEETVKALDKALAFIQEVVKNKGVILFVGTQSGAKSAIKELAEKFGFPYVINRWLGGTLTNFDTLSARIEYLQELEEASQSGAWEKFTKKERTHLAQELSKLQKKFAGLRKLKDLPQALFVVDPALHSIAVQEARKLHIPIISILDTDDDPSIIDYPIPANDSAKSSITYIMKKVEEVIEKAMAEIRTPEEAEANETDKEKEEEKISSDMAKV